MKEKEYAASIKKRLAQLEWEHEHLVFPEFDHETGWRIGHDLADRARAEHQPIAICIMLGKHVVFQSAMPGASAVNDQWIRRKNRTVKKFQKSSYYIAELLKSQNRTLEEAYSLKSSMYAASGGAFPIFVKGKGLVGTITISGMPDYVDHTWVTYAIQNYLLQISHD